MTTDTKLQEKRWQIEFTGSGSEYFRIWLVNTLLTLVTLGLYLPFAKARRLRYFYANTLVDGHALAFHGNPWLMLRGFLVMVVLGALYGATTWYAPLAALAVLALLYALFPVLWRAGLQFRLGNTSWRGVRMHFTASTMAMYKSLAPLYIPLLLTLVGSAWLQRITDDSRPGGISDSEMMSTITLVLWVNVASLVAMLALGPLGLAMLKRLQHSGYGYAGERATLYAPTGHFYALVFKGIGLSILVLIALRVMTALLGLRWDADSITSTVLLLVLVYSVFFVTLVPWFTTRLQNLVWDGTHSQNLHFLCDLDVPPMVMLTAKNLALTLVTLGLYRPFAAVSMAKMRLEAVSVMGPADVDTWITTTQANQAGATGDAAGDFFGFDIGL